MVKKRQGSRWIKQRFTKDGKPICLVPPCERICEVYRTTRKYRNYCKNHTHLDMGPYTSWQILREKAIRRDRKICLICGDPAINPVVDHIKPIALGGEEFNINNLQTLCTKCNKVKTKKDQGDIAILRRKEKILSKGQTQLTSIREVKMEIKKRKIADLEPANYNPRKISEEDRERLKNSIQKFGYIEPIIINKKSNTVIGGHQRLEILKELGKEEIDVVEVDVPIEEEKALNIALNKISGDWDDDKLKTVLLDLKDEEIIEFTGFSDKEIKNIIEDVPKLDTEEVDKIGKLQITCPKCSHRFEKRDSAK